MYEAYSQEEEEDTGLSQWASPYLILLGVRGSLRQKLAFRRLCTEPRKSKITHNLTE